MRLNVGIPEELYSAIKGKAEADGCGVMEWVRKALWVAVRGQAPACTHPAQMREHYAWGQRCGRCKEALSDAPLPAEPTLDLLEDERRTLRGR